MKLYKIISGYSLQRLEETVDAFLSGPEAGKWRLQGPPQVFTFDTYAQAMVSTEVPRQ